MANIRNVHVYNPGPRFTVESPFGDRINPKTRLPKFHAGLDFKAPLGTPIPSATDGVVRYSGNNVTGGYGNLVGIESTAGDGKKILVFYAHMTGANMPSVGDQVKKGDVIGLVGNTGSASRGVHLHVSSVNDPAIIADFSEKQDEFARQKGGALGFEVGKENSTDPLEFTNWGASGVYHETRSTPRELYLTDRFYKSPAHAPLYETNRFVKNLKSAAAMVRRTPLFDSDAVEIGVQKPAAEIGAEKPAADSFNERFPAEIEFMPGRRNPGGTLRSHYTVEDSGRANVELPDVILGKQGTLARPHDADGNLLRQRFTPADGSKGASTYEAGGNARPWSWRDTVVDSQNRLIQPVDHVDWDRAGSGQTGVQTTPGYGANGQPVGEPVQQVVAPNAAGPDEATDRAAAYRQQAIAAHLARIDQAKQRIPDFDQVIRSGGRVQVAPDVADEILNSEKSALLQYHLAGNPGTLEELNGLSGKNLARAVGRLEGRLYLPPAGTVTEASPPLSDVRGSAAPTFDPHTTDDMDAFADWLREDQARRRRA